MQGVSGSNPLRSTFGVGSGGLRVYTKVWGVYTKVWGLHQSLGDEVFFGLGLGWVVCW